MGNNLVMVLYQTWINTSQNVNMGVWWGDG